MLLEYWLNTSTEQEKKLISVFRKYFYLCVQNLRGGFFIEHLCHHFDAHGVAFKNFLNNFVCCKVFSRIPILHAFAVLIFDDYKVVRELIPWIR